MVAGNTEQARRNTELGTRNAEHGTRNGAIDYLYREWNNKATGFVSYGGTGNGVRAVEHLRLVLAELMVATVRAQVTLSLLTDFEGFTTFTPDPLREREVHWMLDQVIAWSRALKTVRLLRCSDRDERRRPALTPAI